MRGMCAKGDSARRGHPSSRQDVRDLLAEAERARGS
jgi:hypothetical protein